MLFRSEKLVGTPEFDDVETTLIDNDKRPGQVARASLNYPGSDLLSHAVTSAVPSALEGLTSVFGMGTGVAPPASPPGIGRQSNTLILECSQATSRAHMHQCNVVKPHGRLVPLG